MIRTQLTFWVFVSLDGILLEKRCFKTYPKSLGPAPGFITIQIRYLTINLDFSLERYVFSYVKKFLLAWFTILTTFQRTSQYTHVDNSRSMRNTIFLFWLLLIKIQNLHFLEKRILKNIRRWWCKMSVVKKKCIVLHCLFLRKIQQQQQQQQFIGIPI